VANDTAYVKGLKQLDEFLGTLAPKVERNIMRSGMRAGAKPILVQARVGLGAHNRTGKLARSLRISTKAKNAIVSASVKTNEFYGKFLEFGTEAHTISAKGNGWLSFGGAYVKSVDHPGARAYPFLRPAMDSQAQAALMAVGMHVKKRLTKEGINTTDVLLEGDE
jgi:HK97 gp10 family phage protein